MAESERELFIESICLLLEFWGEKHWSLIWNCFQDQPELADAILLNFAGNIRRNDSSFMDKLSESKNAELYFFINQRFPDKEDPELGERVTPRHMIRDLKETLISKLVNKSTKEACSALKLLSEKLPQKNAYLKWRLREARTNTLRKSWNPPPAPEIINLLQDKNRRYIENEKQLLDTVTESLKRMQENYKGELSIVERFWNYEGGGKRRIYNPKDEETLSNEVADWLKKDLGLTKGIIVNREVQIKIGSQTDIYVSAIRLDDRLNIFKTLTIVIEVKGCWHKKLLSAMENQLLEQYMKSIGLQCGLYLVGWFMCDRWDTGDYRKKDVPKMTIDELKEDHIKQDEISHAYLGYTLVIDGKE